MIDLLFATKQNKIKFLSFDLPPLILLLLLHLLLLFVRKKKTIQKLRCVAYGHHCLHFLSSYSLFNPLNLGCPNHITEIVPVKVPNLDVANSLVFPLSSLIGQLFNHSCLLWNLVL